MYNNYGIKAPKFPENRTEELLLFQQQISYSFSNISLLENALTHSSFANEAKGDMEDNERLEFLGDSVLSLVVSDWLYGNLFLNEGEYTRIRSFVVSEDCLSKIAISINLDKYIRIGKGEEMSGGRQKKAILCDCIEAVFAAIYLDKGFEAAKSFILDLLVPEIKTVINNRHKKDYKTLLQEYVQKRYKKVPVYTLKEVTGPEHNQTFFFEVEINGDYFGPGSGKNKKDAEQNTAMIACSKLGLE